MTLGAPLADGYLEKTNPISFAAQKDVRVYLRGTETLATVYANEALTEPLAQPLQTDEGGRPRGSGGENVWVDSTLRYDIELDGQRMPWNPPGGSGAVASVNGHTGAVVLSAADVGASTPAELAAEKAAREAADAERTVGPGFSVSGDLATFSGTGGKTLQDSGKALSTDGTLAGNSDGLVPTQKAVKTYVDANKGSASNILTVYNVKDATYGAKGDGTTDDATAIQAALTAAAGAGGGIVYLPTGTYIVNSTLTIDNNVTLLGAGKEATTVKLGNTKNVQMLKTARYGLGGSTGGAKGFALRDIGFDGNKANNSTLTTPTVDLDGLAFSIERVKVQNGTKVNLRSIAFSRGDPGSNMEAKVNDLLLLEAGETNLVWEGPHDSVLSKVIAAKFAGGTGINIIASGISKWSDCHTYGNTEYGWKIESGNFDGCEAEGTKKGQVRIAGSTVEWNGGRVFSAGGEDGKIGFVFATGSNGAQISNVIVENCDKGPFSFEGACFSVKLSGLVFGSEAKPALTGTLAEDLDAFNLKVVEPMTLVSGETELAKKFGNLNLFSTGDIDSEGGRIALKERAAAPSQTADKAKIYAIDDGKGNTDLRGRFGSGTDVVIGKQASGVQEVASASTITVLDAGPVTVVKITGTAEIKKITATRPNHMLVLIFTSTAKVVDGENLKLIETKSGTADDAMPLVCDGTNWYQVATLAGN